MQIEQKEDTVSIKQSGVESNKLIRNTYTLLSVTLLFSALMSWVSIITNAPQVHWALYLIGLFGLLFFIDYFKNSAWGLIGVFAFTGFIGYTSGHTINLYLTNFNNGAELVTLAFSLTAAIFLSLSAYALTTKKDFSFMGGFLFAGMCVAIIIGLVAILFKISVLSLIFSGVVSILMCGMILYDTSEMIHGREDNYIMATIGLYLNIYNLFLSLLQLLGAAMGDD